MEDRRASRRFRAADYARDRKRCVRGHFKVLDRISGKSIGYLIDISSEGLMLLSKSFIKDNTTYRMRIELPEEVRGSNQLVVDARSIWCERDRDSEYFRAGFSFVTAFPHHEEIIRVIFPDTETERVPSAQIVG